MKRQSPPICGCISTMTMIMPKGSMRSSTSEPARGNNPERTRPPSSGGIGMRLKTISITLICIPNSQTDSSQALSRFESASTIPTNIASNVHPVAIARFAPGPAAATRIMSRFGWRRLRNATGTGLAQPNVHAPLVSHSRANGRTTVPIGSTCFSGFRDKRPSMNAVESPSFLAAQPWATSCSVMAKIPGIATTEIVRSSLAISNPGIGALYVRYRVGRSAFECRDVALASAHDDDLVATQVEHGSRFHAAVTAIDDQVDLTRESVANLLRFGHRE